MVVDKVAMDGGVEYLLQELRRHSNDRDVEVTAGGQLLADMVGQNNQHIVPAEHDLLLVVEYMTTSVANNQNIHAVRSELLLMKWW